MTLGDLSSTLATHEIQRYDSWLPGKPEVSIMNEYSMRTILAACFRSHRIPHSIVILGTKHGDIVRLSYNVRLSVYNSLVSKTCGSLSRRLVLQVAEVQKMQWQNGALPSFTERPSEGPWVASFNYK